MVMASPANGSDAAGPDDAVRSAGAASGGRSVEGWAELLGIDPRHLTPADATWFDDEAAWVASARRLLSEVLAEYPDAQWSLTPGGDAS